MYCHTLTCNCCVLPYTGALVHADPEEVQYWKEVEQEELIVEEDSGSSEDEEGQQQQQEQQQPDA